MRWFWTEEDERRILKEFESALPEPQYGVTPNGLKYWFDPPLFEKGWRLRTQTTKVKEQ